MINAVVLGRGNIVLLLVSLPNHRQLAGPIVCARSGWHSHVFCCTYHLENLTVLCWTYAERYYNALFSQKVKLKTVLGKPSQEDCNHFTRVKLLLSGSGDPETSTKAHENDISGLFPRLINEPDLGRDIQAMSVLVKPRQGLTSVKSLKIQIKRWPRWRREEKCGWRVLSLRVTGQGWLSSAFGNITKTYWLNLPKFYVAGNTVKVKGLWESV